MIDFLTSDAGMMMILLLGILGIVGYVILTIIESILVDDFDPVCEQKCRQCICYGMCKEHGCHYECPDYMTEEMLRDRGFEEDEP